MNIGRTIHFALIAILTLTLCAAAAAQRCTRPAPSGERPDWNAAGLNRARINEQQHIMNAMARGTYGRAPDSPGKKETLALKRRQQLQQRVVSQSAQLLVMAQRLNADVAASSADHLSVSTIKEAKIIEKLAKSIKGTMENGF